MATGLSWDEAAGKTGSVGWDDAAGMGGGTAPSKPAPPTSSPSIWERIAGPQMLNAIDRAGLATGLIDPSTYRGRDPQPNAATIVTNPAPRSSGQQFLDEASDMATHYSPAALAARVVAEHAPNAYDYDPNHLYSPEQKAQQRGQRIVDAERDAREQIGLRNEADPAWKSGEGLGGNLERGAGKVLGGMAGWTIGDPTSLILPGRSWWQKALGAGGIGGGTDALLQGGEIAEGVRDRYDPVQTAVVAGFGAGTTGLVEGARSGAPALREWWAARGVKTDNIPDEQLVAGSLDGTIGDGSITPDQVDSILRGAGTSPDAFSSPEAAFTAAQRAQGVQARAPINLSDGIPAGISSKSSGKHIDRILAERAQPGFEAPPRVIPGETSIIAAPEGGIRSDDPGAMVGLARKRAADSGVIEQGRQLIDQFPVFGEILNADVPAEVKAGTIWKQMNDTIEQMRREGQAADQEQFTATPWQAPTPEAATQAARRAANPQSSAIHDITMGTESAGRRFGTDGKLLTSPKGAQGEMQVMPGTSRDPGYGVRPAQNNSPDELARVGRDYIDALRNHYDGDMEKAWAAYNAGPGAVDGALAKYGRDWLGHMPAETRSYVGKNMDRLAGTAPDLARRPEAQWRAADYSATENARGEGYGFDPIDANATLRAKSTDNMGVAEDLTAPTSKTTEELNRPGARGEDMATGAPTRPFKATGDDPFNQPGFWEERSRRMADEAQTKAQADLEAEWDRRRAAQEERQRRRSGKTRFEEERTNTEQDASQRYSGKYGQRPHRDGDFWRTTDDGFVSDKAGQPVAFRNAREAAQWAAKNQMGGDFELHTWATNSKRVVLRRRANSAYGQAAEAMSPEEAAREFTGSADYDRSATPDSRGKLLEGPASRPGFDPATFRNQAGEVPGVGTPAAGGHVTDPAFNYRSLSKGEIDAIGRDGWALPQEGAAKRGANRKHWATGDGKLHYAPDHTFIRTPKEGFTPDAPIRADRIEVWNRDTGAFEPIARQEAARPAPRETYEASRSEGWRSPVNDSRHGPIEARRVGLAEDRQIRSEAATRYGDTADAWTERTAFHNGANGYDPFAGMPINADRARTMQAWEDGMHYGRQLEGQPPTPSPAGSVTLSAGTTAGPKKPRPSTRSREAKPTDMARFIASMGGIADTEGHSLSKGRGLGDFFVPGYGKLIRKNGGNTIDRIGEALHEAGFFGPYRTTERPTVAQVLEKIDELPRRKVYRPEDVAEVEATERAAAGDQERLQRLSEIDDEFKRLGYATTPDELDHVLDRVAAGESPAEAVDSWLMSEASLAYDEIRGGTAGPKGDNDFEFGANVDEPDPRTGASPSADDGSAEPPRSVGGDEEPRPEAAPGDRGEPSAPSQSDAFGTRPGDQRSALERQGEGRQRSGKEQKAPGSEGGLFDTRDTTGTLFRRAKREGFASTGRTWAKAPLAPELERVAREAVDPAQRALAEALAPLVGDIEVRFGPVENDRPFERTKGLVSLYDDDGPMSVAVHSRDDVETLLHEAVHTATMARYGMLAHADLADRYTIVSHGIKGKDAEQPITELVRLYQRAQKSWRPRFDPNGRISNALSDPDEFLAYGLTNPTFQKWLKGMNTAGLWGRFVDAVRGILGLAPKYGNMLDQVLTTGAELLEKAKQDAPIGERLGTGAAPRDAEPAVRLFSKESGDEGEARGRLLDMAFHPDAVDDAAKLVGSLKESFGSPKGAWDSIKTGFRKAASPLLYSNDGRLRASAKMFNSPTLDAIADIFHSEAGKDRAVRETYHEAVQRESVQSMQKAFDAAADLIDSPASMLRIRDMLTTPSKVVKATDAERQAARVWRDILKERLEYRRAAGEDIGSVENYFRRQFSPEKIVKNAEAFKKLAANEYRKLGADKPEDAADAWFKHIFDTYAGVDGGGRFAASGGTGVGSSSAKTRVFGPEADQVFKDFLEDDVWHTMTSYLSGAARRAEQTRRFGAKGAVGSPERLEWERQHQGKSQWEVSLNKVREEVIASGREASGVMSMVDNVYAANLGQYGAMPPRMRATISGLHAWTQLRTMDRATFSSLGDMMMGFVRGGPRYGFQHISTGLNEFIRHVRRAPESEATRYAEALGVANDAIQSQTLYARASMDQVGNASHKIIDRYHRAILLKQWTDGMRIGAMKTGQRFISDLAEDLASSNAKVKERASFYLKELGVQDPEAFGTQHRAASGAPSRDAVLNAREGTFEREYATALTRYVNQSILMPSRAERPTWASHPVGGLFFSLQSYSAGFKRNVLDRVGRLGVKAVKERDPAYLVPAAGLTALLGFTYAQEELRRNVFGSNYDFEHETPIQFGMRIADRAGMFGGLSPVVNAFEGVKYQRSVAAGFTGPAIGPPIDLLEKGVALHERNSENTNSAERNFAGAVYDVAINPAINFVAANMAGKAAVAGSAIILGKGRNEKGLLPDVRGGFVDEMAGPKAEK